MSIDDAALAGLAERLARHMSATQATLATAESCTGGWIAKALTDIAGSSRWFLEGFVTYGNAAKNHSLGVPLATLRDAGAVSERTAIAMAKGALRRSGSVVAVSVTGIAGPGGAVPGKPVGTVWLCWAERRGRSIRVTTQRKQFRGDREMVRRKTVRAALLGLMRK